MVVYKFFVWLTPPSPSRYILFGSDLFFALGLVDPAVSKSLYSTCIEDAAGRLSG